MYSDDEFLELLRDRYGVSIIENLTSKQGEDLLAYSRSLGFGKPKRKWTCTLCVRRPMEGACDKGISVPPNNAQYSTINVLKEAVQWGHPQGFEKWLFKYFGLREIKCGQYATMVITALKGVIRSQKKRCTGCKWQFDIDPDKGGKIMPKNVLSKISGRALMQRINRRLAEKGQLLRKSRKLDVKNNLGEYYTININRNVVEDSHIDLQDFGRKIGALAPQEELCIK
jgi:hypothetical protein